MPTIVKRGIRVRGRVDPKTGYISGAKIVKTYSKRRATKQLRKVLKSVVNRSMETKYVSAKYDTTHNSGIGSADPFALCPAVTQGTDDYQRVGDRIKGKYLYIKGKVQWDMNYILSNGSTNLPPVTIRALILSQRNVRSNAAIPGDVITAALLKDNVGTGAARSYTGGPWDNLAPINKDLFTVHMDKKIKLNWFHPTDVTTGSAVATSGTDHTKYFYCRIPVKKNLYFDSTLGNVPDNFAPFFVLGAVNDDGEAPYTTGTPFHVSMLSTLYFTDA